MHRGRTERQRQEEERDEQQKKAIRDKGLVSDEVTALLACCHSTIEAELEEERRQKEQMEAQTCNLGGTSGATPGLETGFRN